MKLSVVIVNYNVRYYLEQCLLSVERALTGISAEVFVVDNNSTDGSVEYLRPKFPWVTYIENDKNIGFSKANNQAIRKSRGEYVLLLNPDTFVGESALKDCVDFMDKTPEAGMCGVRMLKIDGGFAPESRRGVPTPFTSFCKMSGLCTLFPKSRTFGKYYMQYLDVNDVNQIDIISGAFMFIRKSALDKIGLLDETFFMYGEDVDLSYRSLMGGFKNYYVPTPILHYKGESTKKASFGYINAFHKAMIIFFRKHFAHRNPLFELLIDMAVCFKGATAFVKNKFVANKDNNTAPKQEHFLFVSDGYNLEMMKDIAARNDIKYDVYKADRNQMPPKDVLNQGYDYVVFDTDRYPFTSILEFFRHDDSRRRDTNIATYLSYSQSIMILHGAVR